jgi:hypothetical protein
MCTFFFLIYFANSEIINKNQKEGCREKFVCSLFIANLRFCVVFAEAFCEIRESRIANRKMELGKFIEIEMKYMQKFYELF